MKFLYKPISNSKQYGRYTRPLSNIKWIVIHYTGNYSKGANAMAHYRYLQTATRFGSAHYYVDDTEIIQTIGDSRIAWSVADQQGYGRFLNGCNNSNSINIEMCVNVDSDQDLVYKNTVELTKNLMKKFNIPADRVCRHYDVSRKDCPHNFRANNWAKWWQFKEDIKQPIKWKMNLDRDSEFGTNINDDIKEVINMLEKWQEEEGKKALKELGEKGLIEPTKWENHLGESTPNWLLFTMLARLAK